MGSTIEAWIEYDDDARYYRERAVEPPFSRPHDNCIPLNYFSMFRQAKDYRFFSAIAGIRSQQGDPAPLFPLRGGLPPNVSERTKRQVTRGGLPPNVSERTKRQVTEDIGEDGPGLGWLSYPEIEQALAHMNIPREKLALATILVLELMQSIERRLGEGRSRLIFYIE